MMVRILNVGVVLAIVTLVAACGSLPDTAAPSTESVAAEPVVLTPVLAELIAPPVPVPATDGKVHMAYELKLTNALGQDVTVTSLAAKAGDRTLVSLSGDKLAYWMRVAGNPTPTTKLGPAQSA